MPTVFCEKESFTEQPQAPKHHLSKSDGRPPRKLARTSSISTCSLAVSLVDLCKLFASTAPEKPRSVLQTSYLRPGSVFKGRQYAGKKSYDVGITLQHVDLNRNRLNGYLTIKGLTETNPEITTFFEAEVIGERYNFVKRKSPGSLNLSDSIDLENWSRFPHFKESLLPKVRSCLVRGEELYVHREPLSQRYLYMRWKEAFLVPDATEKLENASYDGLYYICLDQQTGKISGCYYHKSTENQILEVKAENRGGVGGDYEFF